jgi:uncharacterized secreted repeat protein (TIGR03808 family)
MRQAFDRRCFILGGLSLSTAGSVPARASAQAGPDVTRALQREIDEAAARFRPFVVPAGTSHVRGLRLPAGTRLIGAGRGSRLALIGSGPLIAVDAGDHAAIENVVLDGAARPLPDQRALIEAHGVADLLIAGCAIERAGGIGLKLERCGGQVRQTDFAAMGKSAIFALDSTGLSILENRIGNCGDNGIQVWRSSPGDDGTVVRGNRVTRIRAVSGGDGPFGNGISIYRAGGVSVEGNVVRDCAFTAIRCNSASNVIVTGNNCADLGEVALYVEFAFQGAVVANNLVDGAAVGISITNIDHGGRLAACSGNVVRNLDRRRPQGDEIGGLGIHVEADTAVTGNVIEGASGVGLLLGWGEGLRDVLASANLIRGCEVGAGVSVVPGAGAASLIGNTIAGSRRAAIAGMRWSEVAVPDLARDIADHPHVRLADNRVV